MFWENMATSRDFWNFEGILHFNSRIRSRIAIFVELVLFPTPMIMGRIPPSFLAGRLSGIIAGMDSSFFWEYGVPEVATKIARILDI